MKQKYFLTIFAVSVVSFVTSFALAYLDLLLMKWNVSPHAGPDPFIVGGLRVLLFLAATAFVFFGVGMFFYPPKKRVGSLLFCGGAAYLLAAVLSMFCLDSWVDVRKDAFRKLGHRLEPLVHAIENYKIDKGYYPNKLEELIPSYLDSLPQTNMAKYSKYHYYTGEKANDYEGNPWVIIMNTGWGLGFDKFMYFPLQNYPEYGYGGMVQRLDKWAYVFE